MMGLSWSFTCYRRILLDQLQFLENKEFSDLICLDFIEFNTHMAMVVVLK